MQELFELDSVNVSGILDVVMGCGEIASLPDDVQFKVRLCVEEVVENIFSYSKAIRVDVSVTTEDSMLVIRLEDDGIPFDPLSKKDPDINAPLEDRPVGGLGIFLCKQMMDSLEYEFHDGHNIMVLHKKIR